MTKEISKLISFDMNDGRIFAGFCDAVNQNKREIILRDACEIQPKLVEKDYKNRIKELYNSYKVKREIIVKVDNIEKPHIIY